MKKFIEKNWLFIAVIIAALVITYFVLRKNDYLPGWMKMKEKGRSLGLQTPYMQGEDVRELQAILQELYAKSTIDVSPGTVDGVYGPNTEAAHNAAIRIYSLNSRTLDALQKVSA